MRMWFFIACFACTSNVAASMPALGQEVGSEASADAPGSDAPTLRAPHTYGIVESRSAWHLVLVDGRTVDLARTTTIAPVGETIRPGDRLGIFGYYERPMTFFATSVTVIRDFSSAGVEHVKGQ